MENPAKESINDWLQLNLGDKEEDKVLHLRQASLRLCCEKYVDVVIHWQQFNQQLRRHGWELKDPNTGTVYQCASIESAIGNSIG